MVPPDVFERARIADALGPRPVQIDTITRHAGLSASAIIAFLLELDIGARLHRHAGCLVCLAMGD
ncbi:hypothetical protein RGR602_CH01507 [Rhizobium gallicum bv. gallicum R602sp]|uniref:DprA winged helix domain-containing protein n=2 Tax=Rhizobium gallicum TaxID=56730 RepID=A0A0B4WYV2_9HYPH|nr:hypothetical protein [Rhizobium sp. SEMIA 4085]AJD40859.1 hypothetical protein RGR602_CH01507 [Rhizobium gallicum bv. gallicum R602sp]